MAAQRYRRGSARIAPKFNALGPTAESIGAHPLGGPALISVIQRFAASRRRIFRKPVGELGWGIDDWHNIRGGSQ